MNTISTVLKQVLLPIIIIALFFLVHYYQADIPKNLFSFLPELFFIMATIVFAVSWHFNRNKFLFILLPLILFYAIIHFTQLKDKELFTNLFSLFFPLHILLFSLFRERGLLSLWGALKVVLLSLEMIGVYYLFVHQQSLLITLFKFSIFDASLSSWTSLSDITLLITLIVMLLFTLLSLFHYLMRYHTSFFGIVFLSSVAIHFSSNETTMTLAYLSILLVTFTLLIKESYRLAFYDQLTELPGRRALIEDMAKLGRAYTLAMIDIDHFKKFNDTYGHDTGDDVLKMVASKIGAVAGGGKAYRYGGEEFTILFPSKTVAESYVYVDAVREMVATSAFVVRNKKGNKTIFVNISGGVVEKTAKDKDPMAVMKRADNALYKAKKAGRNRVIKG